jgi:hypothetical protein
LQFIGHGEGRVRFISASHQSAAHYMTIFVKDHLGNVRVVLTNELQQDTYPAGTLEGSDHIKLVFHVFYFRILLLFATFLTPHPCRTNSISSLLHIWL